MAEAVFPVLGALFVVIVVLPASALITKAALAFLERDALGGPLHGLGLRHLLLLAQAALPLAWIVSASALQLGKLEAGASLACLFEHERASVCVEPLYLLFALALFVAFHCSRALSRSLPSASAPLPENDPGAKTLALRIATLLTHEPSLRVLEGRVLLTDDETISIETRGLLRPRILLGRAFAEELTDPMLLAALGHESEHLRASDPLRYLLLEIALRLNPLGRPLLEPHARRFRAAREAHCDREAVLRGAHPLCLAHAILRAARPEHASSSGAAALADDDTGILHLRIGMLLAYAEHMPSRCCAEGRGLLLSALLAFLIALSLPYQLGTGALDLLHLGAERAFAFFFFE